MAVTFNMHRSTTLHTDADNAGVADAGDILRRILTFTNSRANPPASAAIAYTFNDGNAGAQSPGGALVDDPPVAVADAYATNENAVLTVPAPGVLTNDTDSDGGPKFVESMNGDIANVGVAVTLSSGAKVTLNADGSLTYDPNHQFDTLTSTSSGETGAVNTSAVDSFTYALNGGSSTTVNVTVNGVASAQDHLNGDATNNTINGTASGDYFDLSQGGNDTANGLGGNDGFFFGAAFTAADHVDGGSGTNDQIGLQGDYATSSLVLGASTITNIEVIVVLPGFSYTITTNDANVAAGGLLKVQATQLAAGESLIFNGANEHNGSFIVYGGQGNDNMTGGDGNDGFWFGPGGFNSSDTVNGGPGGNDQIGLDGNYGGSGPAFELSGGNITNIEVVVLLPGPSNSPNNFNITTNDSLVAAGQSMTIFGLQVMTSIIFDGSHEHDGALSFYGGFANDWIFGGDGGDLLAGGAGGDTFYYDAASRSTSLGFDKLLYFDDNEDKIDLPFSVSGLATEASGNLSTGSFDSDLSSAFAGLTSHQAGMFTATGGNMAGRTFLVIDADGNAGYQAGSDYVMEIISPPTPVNNPHIFI